MSDSDKSPATLPWNQSGGSANSISAISSNSSQIVGGNCDESLNKGPQKLDSLSPTLYSGKSRRKAGGLAENGQVKELLTWAGKRCGLEEFASGINVVWNNRFTMICGRATFCGFKIELAAKMWPLLSEELKREALIHEACHLFVHKRYGTLKDGHGSEWKSMMQLCGYPAPSKMIVTPCKVAYCRCKTYYITPRMLDGIRRGKVFYCGTCNSDVMPTPYEK